MSEILKTLLDVLPVISRISGGYATVTARDGARIKTFDSEGEEVEELIGKVYKLAQKAGETGSIQTGKSVIVENAEAWAFPIGEYVLAASNIELVLREQKLKEALQEALPLIARVAGGEAVLFDNKGTRLLSYDYQGNISKRFIGSVSKAAQEAMEKQKPVIGESMSVTGAVGVRIPITKEYGFGFNNEEGTQREHKLLEEVKKFQYAKYNFSDIIGESDAIKKVKSIASFISQGISSVLILGETGTGKELFAQAIHNSSERRAEPFVAINCGALPSSLIESYLFGYEGGAFTGAKKSGNPGSFEQANGGTIFLDEISEMDYNLQSKLLRVLQEREVTRIGSSQSIKIDVRVISATNKDLTEQIRSGNFREDLFYRLNVVQIKVPSLKERIEDIPLLVKHFINSYNKLLGKYVVGISEGARNYLLAYEWPGNVRQLQNCIEHAMNMVKLNENTINVGHLPSYIFENKNIRQQPKMLSLTEVVAEAEKEAIEKALKIKGGSKKDAAHSLGISTTTLWRKMTEYGIRLD